MPRWTEEAFTVSGIRYTDPPTYKIKYKNGEEIQGTFYEPELKLTNQQVFRIEKVIQTRGSKAFVNRLGYPESFNSCIDTKELIRLQ